MHIFDGKKSSSLIKEDIKKKVDVIRETYNGAIPKLCVILVGDDPASHIYVNNKKKTALALGMESEVHILPSDTSQNTLEDLIDRLNNTDTIHGILVQMPLPKHIDEERIIQKINPIKDVDGFHPINVGMLHRAGTEKDILLPCTPSGCMHLLSEVKTDLSSLHAVVIGRSHIVGRPLAEMLLQKNATVTIAHSRTHNIQDITKTADILISAVGRPQMITQDWVKEGVIAIDVGINRIEHDGTFKVIGDFCFDSVSSKASAITPVPGGVGPMTIAFLMQNTLKAFYMQNPSLSSIA